MSTTAAKIRREITRDGKTVRYVHVFCDACTYWHGFGFTVLESFDPAERHLMNVHGLDAREASTARRQWEHNQKSKTSRKEATHEPNVQDRDPHARSEVDAADRVGEL